MSKEAVSSLFLHGAQAQKLFFLFLNLLILLDRKFLIKINKLKFYKTTFIWL